MWSSLIKTAWRRQWQRTEQSSRGVRFPLRCRGRLLQIRHHAVVAAAASAAAERLAEVGRCCINRTKTRIVETAVLVPWEGSALQRVCINASQMNAFIYQSSECPAGEYGGGRGEGGRGRGDGVFAGRGAPRGRGRGDRGGRGRGTRDDMDVGKQPDHHARHLDLSGSAGQGFGQGRAEKDGNTAPKSNADFRAMFVPRNVLQKK